MKVQFVKTWAGRLQRFLVRLWGVLPISLGGLVVLTLACLAVRFDGLPNSDMVIVALGAGVVVLGCCSILMVSFRALLVFFWLRRYHHDTPELNLTVETGQSRLTEFSLARTWWLPFIYVSWRWLEPQASIDPLSLEGRLKETVTFEQRGIFDKVEREFVIQDLFGLSKVRFRFSGPATITALPHYGKLLQPPLLIRLSSGDEISDPRGDPAGDRVDMRQYVRGDAPRTILWKVYARTRRMMVRVPERALAAKPRVCSYLVCGQGDEPAAALARVVLEKQLLGQGWRFGCDGSQGHSADIASSLERIARSGNHPADTPHELGQVKAYLEQARTDGYAQCLLMLPPKLHTPEASQELARIAASAGMAVTICMAVDGVEAEQKASRLRKLLLFQEDRAGATASDLRRASEVWGRHPGEVMLVDRAAGVMLGDLRHYQRLKERSA